MELKMKIRCGTDIIEINRIQKAVERTGNKFLQNIFTEQEIEYCEARKMQKYQHYAARFAAKEATFKALSEYMKEEFQWKSFEVLKNDFGKPEMHLNCCVNGLVSLDLSISHCKEYATANVVAIFEN